MSTTTTAPPRPQAEYAPEIPARNLPPVPYRDLPDAPPLRKVLGPSVILVGVGSATGLLIALDRRFLPEPIKVRGIRLGALAWCFAFFGVFSIIYGVEQFKQLF
jgi:hypothetical protein